MAMFTQSPDIASPVLSIESAGATTISGAGRFSGWTGTFEPPTNGAGESMFAPAVAPEVSVDDTIRFALSHYGDLFRRLAD